MLQIYLRSIHCHEETSELSGSDEPYVLVTAVNLASAIPAFDVTRYGPFGDVDRGETHFAPGISQSFWGIANVPAELRDPDKVIFVAALMEQDGGNPEVLRGIVKGIVGSSIAGSLSLDRGAKVAKLIRDVNAALGTPTAVSVDQDDKIGDPQELRFSREELLGAESGQIIGRSLEFRGGGGRFTLIFEARKPARVAANPFDRFVVTMGNRILVTVNDGKVFGHDITGTTVGPAFRLGGPLVAANPFDKRVLTMGNRILVILDDGRVFGHDVTGTTVGPAFQFA